MARAPCGTGLTMTAEWDLSKGRGTRVPCPRAGRGRASLLCAFAGAGLPLGDRAAPRGGVARTSCCQENGACPRCVRLGHRPRIPRPWFVTATVTLALPLASPPVWVLGLAGKPQPGARWEQSCRSRRGPGGGTRMAGGASRTRRQLGRLSRWRVAQAGHAAPPRPPCTPRTGRERLLLTPFCPACPPGGGGPPPRCGVGAAADTARKPGRGVP